ncbi:ferrous iron transport protein B [Ferrimonas marina]|uniref:Ferrous iron transport protein B n=1 Tax=Ferrimonas marina TaxID=299255 RepID=A0A1M5YUD1_9GAMM|nr:ferrous iron transport protein B [Ferrimonas marina]SHI15575.1 ferrous iron transport protein B [Ferrimonas marina]
MSTQFHFALVGNPNSGKSTLFNLLTGANAKVGNWAGVTVGQSAHDLTLDKGSAKLIDLPGLYDLSAHTGPEDEAIARQVLLAKQYDALVNVVDACQLERHLYLTTQLRELGKPMLVLLNKWDAAAGVLSDTALATLEQRFQCKILPISARDPKSRQQVLAALNSLTSTNSASWQLNYGSELEAKLSGDDRALALAELAQQGDADLLQQLSQVRHQWVDDTLKAVQSQASQATGWTEKLDSVVLHPFAGIPVFLLMMYLTFVFAIHMGAAFIDFFDIMAGALFVDGAAMVYESIGLPDWLIGLLANGLGMGIQTVATFIPVVAFLFFALGILETSGYLARAAFVVEGAMNKLGLPGKAFVPLIVGFGCNVPAITATRTLEYKRQRIMTAMMAPFMSCGARLPVYALFAAAFFQSNGQNLVFVLYLVGIAAAIFTGLVLRFTLLPGKAGHAVMELPNYEWPSARAILDRTWMRTRQFVLGAGKVIVIVVTLLSFVNTLGTDGTIGHEDTDESLLAVAAQTVTPVFKPMGIEQDNWPATVGIITGIFAKEAVVGTLNSLYGGEGEEEEGFHLGEIFVEALLTIPEEMLGIDLADPLGIDIGDLSNLEEMGEEHGFESASLGNLEAAFVTQTAAVAYLLFILLYTPCAAVLGAIAGELGRGWTAFSAVWTFGLGYGVAVSYYQLVSFGLAGLPVVLVVLVVFALAVLAMRKAAGRPKPSVGDIPVTMR